VVYFVSHESLTKRIEAGEKTKQEETLIRRDELLTKRREAKERTIYEFEKLKLQIELKKLENN
jgi:hypothetical protein